MAKPETFPLPAAARAKTRHPARMSARPDTPVDARTGRDKICEVICWAQAAGFHSIAAKLSDALVLIPEAEALERLLAISATDHEEIRRIAWLRMRLSNQLLLHRDIC